MSALDAEVASVSGHPRMSSCHNVSEALVGDTVLVVVVALVAVVVDGEFVETAPKLLLLPDCEIEFEVIRLDPVDTSGTTLTVVEDVEDAAVVEVEWSVVSNEDGAIVTEDGGEPAVVTTNVSIGAVAGELLPPGADNDDVDVER